jgi:DNA-binding response OmpR family regulator
MPKRLFIVEDDPSIRFGLEELLKGEGYDVVSVERGDGAVEETLRRKPCDLVLLDIMLPGRSGYVICKELRAAGFRMPILMLTAKGQELDKVLGLDAGADDYVTKPFGTRELLARINALLRRTETHLHTAQLAEPFLVGDCAVDPKNFLLSRAGEGESLTPKEMSLLVCLHRHRGEVLSREQLLNEVWGVNYYGTTRTLDQTVAQLRKKLGDCGAQPKLLLTVHGVGYKLA